MNQTKSIAGIILISVLSLIISCYRTPQFGKSSIDKVIKAMTLEEKISLLVGVGAFNGDSISKDIKEAKNLIPGCAGATCPIPRLGIPSIQMPDGPAGVRINPTRENDENTYYCTAFPVATMLASTWNTELVESVGASIGDEVKRYGADVLLAPALNLHRNPLLGRTFEYYAEDPVLAGQITASMIRGIQSNGVGATIKHFALNNQETNRMKNNVIVPEDVARELYLKGFEIAVRESQPWAVMTSYNKINGTYSPENPNLIDSILRQEWGFEGAVMTDWTGGQSAVAMVKAQNDLLMPGSAAQIKEITDAVLDGTLSIAEINRNVKHLLELIEKSPKAKGYVFKNDPDLKGHAEIARTSGAEGIVLLKNNQQTLPFSKDVERIALYGVSSYNLYVVGTGSGSVNYKEAIGIDKGLEQAGYKLDPAVSTPIKSYVDEMMKSVRRGRMMNGGLREHVLPESLMRKPYQLRADAIANDIAVITIGRSCGEFRDRTFDEDWILSDMETTLINEVCTAFHLKGKKVVVLLNIGAPIETASWKEKPDAILLVGLPGQEGGYAISDILKGKINPSGKLVDTYPIDYFQIPSTTNFPWNARDLEFQARENRMSGNQIQIASYDYTNYAEGFNIGYRYYDRHPEAVSFPFGFGLSYSKYTYSEPKAEYKDGNIVMSVRVTNSGDIAGKEAVEVFFESPEKDADKPQKELKTFAKTGLLQPSESEVLEFKLNEYDLAAFSIKNSCWETTAGEYTIDFAASSQDIRSRANIILPETKRYPAYGSLQ